MDTIRLRTLALKSIMGFGRYDEMTVHQVLSLKHTRYLRWCYYNLSMISFASDILEFIGIKKDEEIEKPGVNPEMFELVDSQIMNANGALNEHIINKTCKARTKEHYKRKYFSRKIEFNKRAMQAKNQGH